MLCRYLHTIEWAASFVLLCVFVSVCCLTDLFCFFPMLRGWRWAFKNLYLALNANNHLEIQEPFLPDFRNCNFLPSVRFLRYCFFCPHSDFHKGLLIQQELDHVADIGFVSHSRLIWRRR